VATFVVLARQITEAPEDFLARGFIIAIGYFIAVLAHDLPTRLRLHTAGVAAGVLADVAATSIAVALLIDYVPLAPVMLLWPIFTAGLATSTLAVLAVAAIETLILLAIKFEERQILTPEAAYAAASWGLLYFVAAFAV